jgi:hypothetical protein
MAVQRGCAEMMTISRGHVGKRGLHKNFSEFNQDDDQFQKLGRFEEGCNRFHVVILYSV